MVLSCFSQYKMYVFIYYNKHLIIYVTFFPKALFHLNDTVDH